MIVYLDSSALVKQYIREPGSEDVIRLVKGAVAVGTTIVSRAETSAALAKAVRLGSLTREEAAAALGVFRAEWFDFVRQPVSDAVVAEADRMAWTHGLRGYDAIHLASAVLWQDALGSRVTIATFDRQLWDSAASVGLAVWPEAL